jgi:hypothetical protein
MAVLPLTAMLLRAGGPDATRVSGASLTRAAVRDAVRGLAGGSLHLEGPADATLVVGGGPTAFFVHATFDNESFAVPVLAGVDAAPVVLTVAGHPAAFPAHSVLDAETTVAIALRWATAIALDASLEWRTT